MIFRHSSSKLHDITGKIVEGAALLALCFTAHAQNVPLLSGGVGFLSNTTAGATSVQPVAQPLLAMPLGSHVLVESRADIRDFYMQDPHGGYQGNFAAGLTYLQADVLANPKATIVLGRFLLPFNTTNERLTPIWIPRLNEGPLIFGLGTRNSGGGVGGELRGVLVSGPKAQLNYNTYFSTRSSVKNFVSARLAGGQVAVYLPGSRLEIGTSYQRYLQQTHLNTFGAHVWWLPANTGFQLRSEYAHGYGSQGYWVETAYRLSRFGGLDSLIGRMEPVFRIQQTFRNKPNLTGEGDGLPGANTQQADFGFSYHLPGEIRLNASYGRQFTTTNKNLWDISLVHRFLFPAWKGHKK